MGKGTSDGFLRKSRRSRQLPSMCGAGRPEQGERLGLRGGTGQACRNDTEGPDA